MRRQTSKPSRSGSITSRRTASKAPGRQAPQALGGGADSRHLVTERAQVVGHEAPERLVVVDHEDALGHDPGGLRLPHRKRAAGCAAAVCDGSSERPGAGGAGRTPRCPRDQ